MSGPVTGHRGAQTRLLALPAPPHLGPRPSPRGDDAIVGPASTAARAPARHRGAATRWLAQPAQPLVPQPVTEGRRHVCLALPAQPLVPQPVTEGRRHVVRPASTASRAQGRHRGAATRWLAQPARPLVPQPVTEGGDTFVGPASTASRAPGRHRGDTTRLLVLPPRAHLHRTATQRFDALDWGQPRPRFAPHASRARPTYSGTDRLADSHLARARAVRTTLSGAGPRPPVATRRQPKIQHRERARPTAQQGAAADSPDPVGSDVHRVLKPTTSCARAHEVGRLAAEL